MTAALEGSWSTKGYSKALSRRGFVAMSGVALLAGCSTVPGKPTPAAMPRPMTIDKLFSQKLFFIGHRGSGDAWPEHTMAAYAGAIDAGAPAIEVSVSASSDGVLVCHHDTNTLRTTGQDHVIAETTAAELAELRVDAREWLGPATPQEPIPLLRDVLERFAATSVIFIEDKQGTNTAQILQMLDAFPRSTERFVWKQWAGANQFKEAASRGYRTWGYFEPEDLGRFDELAPRFDVLGIHHTATDTQIAQVVASGKPVIVWEVHLRSAVDRLQALGVAGMMCSNVPYLLSKTVAPRDRFASGERAVGDLPWTTDRGWSVQPTWDTASRSIVLDGSDNPSYLMGSLCPLGPSPTFEVTLRWPDQPPMGSQHAGVAFGLGDDSDYRVRVASEIGGYHLIVRPTGEMELFQRAPGLVDGTSLGSVMTRAPGTGEWIGLTVEMTPSEIVVSRDHDPDWSMTVRDARYRGGFLRLTKNYSGGPAVAFRSVMSDAA